MSRKTELAKNTAILTVGKLCTQCISFFLLPLYTAILSTEEYGTFDLLVTYSTLLLPLVNWQLDQGLFRFMLDYRGNKEEQECCGCTACYAICPKEAISMVEDEEGFEYPQIDEKKCVRCYQCIKVCPIKAARAQ